MKNNKIVVESFINTPLELLWERTQNPHNHILWDIRFSEIKYLDEKDEKGFHLLSYITKVGFGVKVSGFGKYLYNKKYKQSTFEFWSEDFKSLINRGKGMWLYQSIGDKIYFKTVFDYDVKFGLLGRYLDKIFRPMFCLATEWSFETLRLWCEEEDINVKARKKWFRFLFFLLRRKFKRYDKKVKTYSWLGGGSPSQSRLLNSDRNI